MTAPVAGEQAPLRFGELPVIDGVATNAVVYHSSRKRLDLSPALGQFLLLARMQRVRPVIVTDEDAALSRFLGLEMAASSGSWVMMRADRHMMDALTGHDLDTLERLDDPVAMSRLPRLDMPGVAPRAVGAVGFDITVHHRATEELRVGALAELVFATLGAPAPDLRGSTEPLNHPWDRQALTMDARRHMPSSPIYRLSAPAPGAVATLQYERGASGLCEHLRGTVPIGPYDEAVGRAVDLSTAVLRRVHQAFTPVIATTTLIDDDPDGYQHLRSRRPEYPLGIMAGPWAVKESGLDVDEIVTGHGGIRLGRSLLPTVLVPFSGDDAPWRQLGGVLRAVGLPGLGHALGLDGSGGGNGR